jgi:hypothetical protein
MQPSQRQRKKQSNLLHQLHHVRQGGTRPKSQAHSSIGQKKMLDRRQHRKEMGHPVLRNKRHLPNWTDFQGVVCSMAMGLGKQEHTGLT